MPAVPSWDAPTAFTLTNPYNGTMSFNTQTSTGLYLLDRSGCKFTVAVRSTTDNVPQSDGAILHHRFLTGTQMELKFVLMGDADSIACDDVLTTMVDQLTGAFRSLLNAGDNIGRLTWDAQGELTRILDDCRLLVYPDFDAGGNLPTLTVTIDSQYPYAQNLTQQSTSITSGGSSTLTNDGTADYFPVFQVHGATSGFTLTNLTTGIQFVYDSTLPGAVAIGGGDYAEIDTFRNTIFLNGSGANLKAGVDELNSDYWSLIVGGNLVSITGANVTVLWAPAWG